jgi:hypothetical protein
MPLLYVDNRHVASIRGKTLCKTVKRSRHLLRSLNAWALDREHVEAAERSGCDRIEVKDTESGTVYQTSLRTLKERGISINFGNFGPQLALPLSLWQVVDDPLKQRLETFQRQLSLL